MVDFMMKNDRFISKLIPTKYIFSNVKWKHLLIIRDWISSSWSNFVLWYHHLVDFFRCSDLFCTRKSAKRNLLSVGVFHVVCRCRFCTTRDKCLLSALLPEHRFSEYKNFKVLSRQQFWNFRLSIALSTKVTKCLVFNEKTNEPVFRWFRLNAA